MGRLIEDTSLRDKVYVFRDRFEAGQALSERLSDYQNADAYVFAIPSGGVPVGIEIAKALKLPLDLLIVRKIQIPYNPEAGFGAVGPDGIPVFNKELLRRLMLTDDEIKEQVKRAVDSIKRREEVFRGKPYPNIKGKIAIIVDDGLASGYTMLAGINFVKGLKAGKIVVAVPTASTRAIEFILGHVDELLCLNVRGGLSFAVADAYINWYDLSEDDVLSIMGIRS